MKRTPLRDAREARNLTLKHVADAIGIDLSNLSRIERGVQMPAPETIVKIHQFFDGAIPVSDILAGYFRQNFPDAGIWTKAESPAQDCHV